MSVKRTLWFSSSSSSSVNELPCSCKGNKSSPSSGSSVFKNIEDAVEKNDCAIKSETASKN